VKEKYRSLVEIFLHPIVIAQDGKFVFVNHAMCELMGCESPDMLLGQEIKSFLVEEDQERVVGYVRDLLLGREGIPKHYEMKVKRVNGEIVHVEAFVEMITYGNRPAVQAMG